MTLHESFVSAREAAGLLGITTARIGVLCRQGRFKGAEKIGAGWIIPREAVNNHKRLPPGMKPRERINKDDIVNFINEADNLKGDVDNDKQ